MLLFAALKSGLPIGIAYFLWVGIFNVMVIAQFWAFANDLYTPEQGKRIFPLIGVGSSLGAWLGSVRAGQVVARGARSRLLFGAAHARRLRLSRAATSAASPRAGPRGAATAAVDEAARQGRRVRADLKDRYLILIAGLVVLLNIVNTSGEYLFGRYVVEQAQAIHGAGPEMAAARERFIGETYSHLFSTVNLVGLPAADVRRLPRVQVPRRRAVAPGPPDCRPDRLPADAARALAALMGILKVADNSLDYSLGNTTKQALWLPTSREAKYKAKQAVDSFFVRMGDVRRPVSCSLANGWRLRCPPSLPSTWCSRASGSPWQGAQRDAAPEGRGRAHGGALAG